MPQHSPNAAAFPTDSLLTWYRVHQRELPFRPRRRGQSGWKIPPNPYHILVSESMAQQTQIATVVPYFLRFVEAFPTVVDLAEADEQRVLTLWQGLGYYRRARNLHAAAKMIVSDFAGRVPASVDELLRLPGVGRYTAGAVASVAYNAPAPIVDGNVARVFSRYFLIDAPIDQPATLKVLWQLATTLVESVSPSRKPAAARLQRGTAPPKSFKVGPRDFNQGVMELGALVCTPKAANCLDCPLQATCRAFAVGRVGDLPIKTPKKKPVAVTHTVMAIARGPKFLFEQRPASGLWSNMWQLPTLENAPTAAPSAPRDESVELQQHLRDRFNLAVTPPQPVAHFIHQTTHRTIRFVVVRCRVVAGRLRPGAGEWRTLDRLDDLPLAKPQLTAIEKLDA